MVAYTMLRVPPELTLVKVTPQPFYRGTVILALDVRRHFLILSQTMSGIRECIEEVANQPVSETSLYESCRRQLRRGAGGLTAGALSWPGSLRAPKAWRPVLATCLGCWWLSVSLSHCPKGCAE